MIRGALVEIRYAVPGIAWHGYPVPVQEQAGFRRLGRIVNLFCQLYFQACLMQHRGLPLLSTEEQLSSLVVCA